MKDDNQTGWYALYLSITQGITPAHAMAAMEGRRRDIRRLTWEEFVAVYRANEEKLHIAQRKRNSTEKSRRYQREYRKNHPMNEEQRKKRVEYLKKYREAKRKKRY